MESLSSYYAFRPNSGTLMARSTFDNVDSSERLREISQHVTIIALCTFASVQPSIASFDNIPAVFIHLSSSKLSYALSALFHYRGDR